jgi:hypothetical protein
LSLRSKNSLYYFSLNNLPSLFFHHLYPQWVYAYWVLTLYTCFLSFVWLWYRWLSLYCTKGLQPWKFPSMLKTCKIEDSLNENWAW